MTGYNYLHACSDLLECFGYVHTRVGLPQALVLSLAHTLVRKIGRLRALFMTCPGVTVSKSPQHAAKQADPADPADPARSNRLRGWRLGTGACLGLCSYTGRYYTRSAPDRLIGRRLTRCPGHKISIVATVICGRRAYWGLLAEHRHYFQAFQRPFHYCSPPRRSQFYKGRALARQGTGIPAREQTKTAGQAMPLMGCC